MVFFSYLQVFAVFSGDLPCITAVGGGREGGITLHPPVVIHIFTRFETSQICF